MWWSHQFGRHASIALAAVSSCYPQLTSPRCRGRRVRQLFTARQDDGAPAPRVASGWLGVLSAAGVQLNHAEPLATWPGTAAARPPAGQNDVPRISSSTQGWQLEPPWVTWVLSSVLSIFCHMSSVIVLMTLTLLAVPPRIGPHSRVVASYI